MHSPNPLTSAKLSADSVRSLALQGGIFDEAHARAFIEKPFADDAVKLRRWDDAAKEDGKRTPDLTHFLNIVGCLMQATGHRGKGPN